MFHFLNNKSLENKPINFLLKNFLGIGSFLAEKYCKQLGFNKTLVFNALSAKQKTYLEYIIIQDKQNFKQEDLLRLVSGHKQNLIKKNSFKGLKHKKLR